MTQLRTGLCAALMALAPVAAPAWQADNLLTVNPLSGGGFEVVGAPGSGGPDFWCAAGDYAMRVLGADSTQRVYLIRSRGAPETSNRTSSVQFSLTPPPGAVPRDGLFLSMRRVGDNLSVAFARNYCLDRKNLEF